MKVMNAVGARPNFIKIAPLIREMRKRGTVEPYLVHIGQHYDAAMAGQFFDDFGIPKPNVSLDVGPGSHALQASEVMRCIEPVMERQRPDFVLGVGDVNSTLAVAVTATKLHIPVARVEAGLRSFDRTMPEEINRRVTDAVFPVGWLQGRTDCVAHFGRVSLSTRRSARKKDHRQIVFCGTVTRLISHFPCRH